MRQSLKVLWVVLSSLFFDFSISGRSDKMAPDAVAVCFQVMKDSNKSWFNSLSVRNWVYCSYRFPDYFSRLWCALFSDNLT